MTAWTQALAEYQRTSLIVDAIDSDRNEQAFDAAADIQGSAIEALLSAPAPDLSAITMKLQVMQQTGIQHLLATILADVERLGQASPAAGKLERPSLEVETTDRCSRCRFWLLDSTHGQGSPVEDGDIAFGRCRRNAPVVIGELAALGVPRVAWGRDTDLEHEELSSAFLYRVAQQPVTESADWCGEYIAVVGA